MLDDDLSHPYLGHYRDAAFVGVNTILRLKKDDLKLFFDQRNHKKPDNDGEVRLSLNIL